MTQGNPSRPRLGDVAAAAGVSTATASLVLRGVAGPSVATAERVLAAAGQLGYRPDRAASALASRRSRSIGVALDLSNPFHADLTLAIQDAALLEDHEVLLATTTAHQDENATAETLLDSRCAALILLGPRTPLADLERIGRQIPVVVLGRPLTNGATVGVVRSADDTGIAEAVGHLVALGHRRIAYLDGPPGAVADLRRDGYRRAMGDARLSRWARVMPGGQTEDDGRAAAPAVFDDGAASGRRRPPGRPTAVVAFNDRSAVGLLAACAEAGIDVPTDLSVIGFDDSALARLPQIALTTVAQDVRSLGKHAVAAAVRRAGGDGDVGPEVVVRPHLVVRTTTASVPVSR